MARRVASESGYYHVVTRSAGQIALFEDDGDRRKYLKLLKAARDAAGVRIIAWVLMTDHVHLVVDCGETPSAVSDFMASLNCAYSKYFNAKTGRTGTLFQGKFWSKPIRNDAQLVATVYYIHMNPQAAGIAPMRAYHWSSYQEYAGTHWVVDTSTLLDYFGGFRAFDTYEGARENVVCEPKEDDLQDADVLAYALGLAGVKTSNELRTLPRKRRDELIRTLHSRGVRGKVIARTFGVGAATVSRVLRK